MSGEEGEFNTTLPQEVLVLRNQYSSSQRGGSRSSLRMENQDSTLRIPMFHGMGKDNERKH
jgi:hypothetical protein